MKKEITYDHQVNSKQRVADHGEVFTSKREVNAMLDLVKQETERIESRFLEPACGTGNFLVEILERKLTVVESKYKKSSLEYQRYAISALSSIYGVDILEENVIACRDRLLGIFTKFYMANCKSNLNHKCLDSAAFLLRKNILWGDALSLMTVGKHPVALVFSEWSLVGGSMIKRRDFIFDVLVNRSHQPSLFSDQNNPVNIPEHGKEFPLTHFLELEKYD